MMKVKFAHVCIVVVFCLAETHAFIGHNSRISFLQQRPRRTWPRGAKSALRERENALYETPKRIQRKTTKAKRKNKQKGSKKFNKEKSRETFLSHRLNKYIVDSKSAVEVVQAIGNHENALTKTAGGGTMNFINYSTAMHRIGRHASVSNTDRTQVLTDPRFALFICSMAEILAGMPTSLSMSQLIGTPARELEKLIFDTRVPIRVLSTSVWGLTKLRVVPPGKTIPVISDEKEAMTKMIQTSLKLRTEVLDSVGSKKRSWIPTLSLLTAYITDVILLKSIHVGSSSPKGQELSTLLWSSASTGRAPQILFDATSRQLLSFFARDQPQQISNTFWAFAKSKRSATHLIDLIEKAADALEESPSFSLKFKPQEFANVAWSLANILMQRNSLSAKKKRQGSDNDDDDRLQACVIRIMRIIARDIVQRCDSYHSQEWSNTIWAMGSIGFGLKTGTTSYNDYFFIKTNDWKQDRALVEEVASVVVSSCVSRLHRFTNQELNNLVYGFARLQLSDATLFSAVGNELGKSYRRNPTGQDIGTTLWAYATMGYFDRSTYENVVSNIEKVKHWNPQEVSNAIYAIGTAQLHPRDAKIFDTSFYPDFQIDEKKLDPLSKAIRILGREMLRDTAFFTPQEMKDALWGLSKASVRYPAIFRACAELLVGKVATRPKPGELHCGTGFDSFSTQSISNFLWAYAKQSQIASMYTITGHGGKLISYLSTHLDLDGDLFKRLLNAALVSQMKDDRVLFPIDVANTMWSVATLGHYHGPYATKMKNEFIKRSKAYIEGDRGVDNFFNSQAFSNLIWGLAVFNKVTPEVLDLLAPYIKCLLKENTKNGFKSTDLETIAATFKRQELASIAWACAVANYFPPDLMRFLYSAIVGKNKKDAARLTEVFGDEGLAEQSVSTMLYVQTLIESNKNLDLDVSLPPDFPAGWIVEGGDVYRTINAPVMVSKVQRSVLDVCHRMGLNTQAEYALQLRKMLSLSLDIAFPEHKVCIEVDGPTHFHFDMDKWNPWDPPNGYAKYVSFDKFDYDFCFDSERVLINGSTVLRNNILSNLGWRVISVSFFEWQAMEGDETKREEFIRDLLKPYNIKCNV